MKDVKPKPHKCEVCGGTPLFGKGNKCRKCYKRGRIKHKSMSQQVNASTLSRGNMTESSLVIIGNNKNLHAVSGGLPSLGKRK